MEIGKIANGVDESMAGGDQPSATSSPVNEMKATPMSLPLKGDNVDSQPILSTLKANINESPLMNGSDDHSVHKLQENGDHIESTNVRSSSAEEILSSPVKNQQDESSSKPAEIVSAQTTVEIADLVPQQTSTPECSEMKSKPICAVEPTPISPVGPSPADCIHRIKWFTWHGTKTPIITQNENGPCPLLAVMNVLLLRGQVNLPDELEVVTSQNLMERLGDCILRLTPTEFAQRPDYQQNISDAIAVLPKLMTGLDVNVKFTGVSEFEYTPECIVFDLLNIPLYHGWLVEPENQEAGKVINSLSYNQLVEKIIDFKGSGDSVKVSEALFAEQFLESSASQLTYHGLYELNQRLKDGELAVFFRNNHFSSLVKHETGLFLLVTDQGFLNEKSVVWETLNNIEGDSKFLDAEFKAILPKTDALAPLPDTASPQEQIDHDLMVAMSLDDQERQAATPVEAVEEYDRQLALQLQQEEDRAGSNSHEASNSQERQNVSSPTESTGTKKKDKCEIL